ncbi:MAG: Rho termination factor N-terminal domain-containing protein, partial [Actinomycetota bacterium]|nr:Rho termination factor N-terminal domain-containing protein [Actinomycetota bacterium]
GRPRGDDGSMTKAELQRRARELDVPGRSSMNRDELAEAVGNAERRAS